MAATRCFAGQSAWPSPDGEIRKKYFGHLWSIGKKVANRLIFYFFGRVCCCGFPKKLTNFLVSLKFGVSRNPSNYVSILMGKNEAAQTRLNEDVETLHWVGQGSAVVVHAIFRGENGHEAA